MDADTRRQLRKGRYQEIKARQLAHKLEPNDRFLDIGAGFGFTALVAAALVGERNVLAVEADPGVAALARANFADNSAAIELLEGAVASAADAPDGMVDFYPNDALGQGARFPRAGGTARIQVPGLDLAGLLQRHQATAVNVDAPGCESDVLVAQRDFGAVRVLLVTVHEAAIGFECTMALIRSLFDHGFALDLDGSCGRDVVFVRT